MKTQNTRNIFVGSLLLLFFFLATTVSAQTMKIAVPTMGLEQDSLISPETGRAPFFLFFDGKGQLIEAIKNPAKDQYGGASRTVAALLVEKGVTLIIADNIGAKMEQALNARHIKYVKKTGVTKDAVQTIIQTR